MGIELKDGMQIDQFQMEVEKAVHIHCQLLKELSGERGPEGLCNVLWQDIRMPLFVFSADGELLFSSQNLKDTDSSEVHSSGISSELHADLSDSINKGNYKDALPNRSNIVRVSGNTFLCIPMYAEKECLAYMFIDCTTGELSNSDIFIVENAAVMIALKTLQLQSTKNQEHMILSRLAEDILYRKYSDLDAIHRRLTHFGFESQGSFIVCDLGADNFEDFLSSNDQVSEDSVQTLKKSVYNIISGKLNQKFSKILYKEHISGTLIIFHIDSSSNVNKCISLVQDILDELTVRHPELLFSAGFSRITNDILRTSTSLEEAKLARKVGQSFKGDGKKRIIMFEDLGPLRFLYGSSRSSEMLRYYNEYLGGLQSYDRQHKTSLVDTLKAYFENNQNIRQTADAMFLHKNSVLYRLKQIEEITGFKLSDPEASFNLQMCIRLRDII